MKGVENSDTVDSSMITAQKEAIERLTDVIFLTLQTQVVEEEPVVFDSGYVRTSAQRTLRGNIQDSFFDEAGNEVQLSDDVSEHLLQNGDAADEVLQVAVSFSYNPYIFGHGSFQPVTSQTVLVYFANSSNGEVQVSGLNSTDSVLLLLHSQDSSDVTRSTRSVTSDGGGVASMQQPSAMQILKPGEILQTKLDLDVHPLADGSSLYVWVRHSIIPQILYLAFYSL